MSNRDDISWPLLRRIVQDWAGSSAELAEAQHLEGGVINTTLRLTTQDGAKAVLKVSPHRVNLDYQREAQQLDLLRSIGLPAPRVYRHEVGTLDAPNSFILMEFIEGIDLTEAKHRCASEEYDQLQQHLAELTFQMHAQSAPEYGRVRSSENNPTFSSWPAFFRHVYDPMVQETEKNNELTPKVRKQIARMHEKLDRLIAHTDQPRLVHWDLWSSNILTRPDDSGQWRVVGILDPNCKYAHCEAEIAYMDLFHTCTPAFMKVYQQQRRLDDGYHQTRKPIYQLYSLINHVCLFGHDYVKPMLNALEKAVGLF